MRFILDSRLHEEAVRILLGRHRSQRSARRLARAAQPFVVASFAEALKIDLGQPILRKDVVGIPLHAILQETADALGLGINGSRVRRDSFQLRGNWSARDNREARREA